MARVHHVPSSSRFPRLLIRWRCLRLPSSNRRHEHLLLRFAASSVAVWGKRSHYPMVPDENELVSVEVPALRLLWEADLAAGRKDDAGGAQPLNPLEMLLELLGRLRTLNSGRDRAKMTTVANVARAHAHSTHTHT
eukprot:1114988-Prymnesium_polylepis.1